jgi:hypothetical protein
MTRKGHMGRTNLWYLVDTGKPSPFPRCPWAVDLSDKPFPTELKRLGKWFWESGFYRDPIVESELIRDTNFRAMYGAWDALKNAKGKYPNHRLAWAAYISGKRESRRLLGDVILTKKDLMEGRTFPDGFVPCTWSIDLHLPDKRYSKGFEDGFEFLSRAHFTHYKRPYLVPYRCFYSRNVENLFMAGRNVSVTHEALGTTRVMRTTGMMGEVVGAAASLCKKHGVLPRAVYSDHLDALKGMLRGPAPAQPRPKKTQAFLESVGKNVASNARIKTSGAREVERQDPKRLVDGADNVRDNPSRWLSKAAVPNWVVFAWDAPRTIGAARIVSGYSAGGAAGSPVADFSLQIEKDGTWQDIPGAVVRGNRRVDWFARFPAVQTRTLRVHVTATPGDISRFWEIGLYSPQRP